ncbi:hypothetical protein DPMN_173238 [Dreissena polymorpha]|uniref:Uncharacterized protein n=1 Tax=Dreissena polymorpha TaxID=45954 RepID=A0A9D4E173_DREPO|nr:hypothetical protein DPMN_173238 [Dreissena polymorpha]
MTHRVHVRSRGSTRCRYLYPVPVGDSFGSWIYLLSPLGVVSKYLFRHSCVTGLLTSLFGQMRNVEYPPWFTVISVNDHQMPLRNGDEVNEIQSYVTQFNF